MDFPERDKPPPVRRRRRASRNDGETGAKAAEEEEQKEEEEEKGGKKRLSGKHGGAKCYRASTSVRSIRLTAFPSSIVAERTFVSRHHPRSVDARGGEN